MLDQPSPAMQRSHGSGALTVKSVDGRSRIGGLHQRANAKIRIPKTYGTALEAVLINTTGGITGGDTLRWSLEAGADTTALVTTQACERVYRSTGDPAEVSTTIDVGDNASFFWLPQETILFEGGRLSRTLDVRLSGSARLLALETVILGREAMGETLQGASLHDRWRIRVGDGLIHADDLRLDIGDEIDTGGQALLAQNRVFATIVSVNPDGDEQRDLDLSGIRALLPETGGASRVGKRIVVRIAARSGYEMRKQLLPVVELMLGGNALPKVWRT
jgi:urease accessory protein